MEHFRLVSITGRTTPLCVVVYRHFVLKLTPPRDRTVKDCRRLFADRPLPTALDNPNPNLEFMWDIMNEKSGSLEAALEFRNEWIPRVGEFHRHAAISLAYTSSQDVLRAVRRCWIGVEYSNVVTESVIRRVFHDPRYERTNPELRQRRPAARLSELISLDTEAFTTLIACDRMLRAGHCSKASLEESATRIFRQLDLTADRLEIFSVRLHSLKGRDLDVI